MTERVLLVDIGAGELPAMTPVVPAYASWLPVVAPPVGLAPPTGVVSTPVADGVLLQWAGLGPYEHIRVEIAPAPAGPWTPLAEVHEGTQCLVTLPAGATEARVVRVKAGIDSAPVNLGTVTPNLLTEVTADMLAEAAADATAKANAAKAEATARANALQAQINDVVGTADDWTNANPYPAGDSVRYSGHLYRAKVAVPANTPPPNTTYWEDVGNYASVGEAVAATVAKAQQNASAIAAEVQRVDGIVVRLPVGNGSLASSAMVADEASARATADGALSERTGVIEGRMPTGNDKLANEARVVNAETASADRDSALADRATALESKVNDPVTGVAASGAILNQAVVDIRAVKQPNPNMKRNPTFANGMETWNMWNSSSIHNSARWGTMIWLPPSRSDQPTGNADNRNCVWSYLDVDIEHWRDYTISVEGWTEDAPGSSAAVWMIVERLKGSNLGYTAGVGSGTSLSWSDAATPRGQPVRKSCTLQASADTDGTKMRIYLLADHTVGSSHFRRLKVEGGPVATPYSDEATINATVSQTNALNLVVGGVNGSAVTSTTLTYRTGVMEASKVEFLKVGNKVVGYRIGNDGLATNFELVADSIELVTGGGYGLALDKTKMDRRFTGMAVYEGNSFGPDNLGYWMGPNTIAKSGATKANAAFWVDYSGQYGGGSAITGSGSYFQKETAASNTLTATTVSFPRSTTRAAREITAVLSMSVQSTKYSNDGTGSSAFSTPFVVEVSRDGGAWTQLDSQGMCNGTITRDNSEPGITYYEANGRGSIVAYDTNSGTNLQYRARETGSMPSVGASAIPNRTISIKVTEI